MNKNTKEKKHLTYSEIKKVVIEGGRDKGQQK